MKKMLLKDFTLILSIVLAALSLTACQSEDLAVEQPVSLAVIYCQREGNSTSGSYFDARFDGDDETLLCKAASPGSEIIIITTSGSPYQSDTIKVPNSDAVTSQQAQDDQYYFAEKIKENLVKTEANAAEADAYEALRIAANWLKSQPDGYPKYCLMIDNGICTTGNLSFFQQGFLSANPETIVNNLAQKSQLPDLKDVTVLFAGLGRTSSPQAEPGTTAQKHIEDLWQLIVTKSGGTAIVAKDKYEMVTGQAKYPVSVINFTSDQPMKFDPSAEVNFDQVQYLGEDQIQFVGDSAEFLNPEQVVQLINPIAEYMKAHPSFKMLLIGTTAGDETTPYCINLSKNRADAVKNALISIGIPQNNLITVGLGSADPWHIYDIGTSSPEASKNRKVVLMSADSEEAKTILKE